MGQLNHDTIALWEGWQRRELRFAHCGACGTWLHAPRRICPDCWSDEISFDAVSGAGWVAGWSLPRTETADAPPVVTALVAIDGASDVHLLARLVGCDPSTVRVGLPVVVDWREEDGVTYPQFRPAAMPS